MNSSSLEFVFWILDPCYFSKRPQFLKLITFVLEFA
jgi:hypothetical protein